MDWWEDEEDYQPGISQFKGTKFYPVNINKDTEKTTPVHKRKEYEESTRGSSIKDDTSKSFTVQDKYASLSDSSKENGGTSSGDDDDGNEINVIDNKERHKMKEVQNDEDSGDEEIKVIYHKEGDIKKEVHDDEDSSEDSSGDEEIKVIFHKEGDIKKEVHDDEDSSEDSSGDEIKVIYHKEGDIKKEVHDDEDSSEDSSGDEEIKVIYHKEGDIKKEVHDDEDSSEDSSTSDSSSSDKKPVTFMGNRTYISQKLWKGTKEEWVERIPPHVDGTHLYKIKIRNDQNPMEISRDLRPWQRYVPSSRAGFLGTRRIAQCSGSMECPNTFCPFKKEFSQVNHYQVVQDGKYKRCMHCNSKMKRTPCDARKIWEIPKSGEVVTVYHYGQHSCTIKRKEKKKRDRSEIIEKFSSMPKATPTQLAFQAVASGFEKDKSWDEIEKIAEEYSDIKAIKNDKKKAVQQKRPHGHSFEAVSVLKKKTDVKDSFLIYEANDGSLNNNLSYVFKSSELRIQLALNMDRFGKHFLASEYCHFDGKHDRCKDFLTLTASVYHPVLRRMVKLAIMECEAENKENLVLFWNLLNRAIKEASKDDTRLFNPCGFICDEAGANWKSLEEVYGHEVLERTKGCELHYMQSVHRHANSLTSKKSKHKFKKLANGLREAPTPAAFKSAHSALVKFIQDKYNKRKHLHHWLKWWTERKTHISKAYRPLYNAPTANLSEPVNSSFQRRGSSNISLIDAALEDVSESVLFKKMWDRQSFGEKTYGTGPTQVELLEREKSKQLKRAHQIGDDAFEEGESREEAYKAAEIDPSCTHRPTKPQKRKRLQAEKRQKRKKNHVSVYDDSEDYSSSSSSGDCPSKKDSRPRVYRRQKSAVFLKSLEKAKACKSEMAVKNTVAKDEDCREYEIASSGSIYKVNVCQLPSCDCPFFCKSRQLCKHILWVYLNVLKVNDSGDKVHQMGLTLEELRDIFRNAPKEVPKDLILEDGASNTFERAFIRHPDKESEQEWVISRKTHEKVAHCSGKPCQERITKGDIHLSVKGLYCPKHCRYAVTTTFRYCINTKCCQRKGPRSNIKPLRDFSVFLDPKAKPSNQEMQTIVDAGFNIKLKIRPL